LHDTDATFEPHSFHRGAPGKNMGGIVVLGLWPVGVSGGFAQIIGGPWPPTPYRSPHDSFTQTYAISHDSDATVSQSRWTTVGIGSPGDRVPVAGTLYTVSKLTVEYFTSR